ncbi:MAG: transcriptional repressor [Bacteroidia bacterium]|nr:transcriptional repressor [Bacteroidia bacterium]MDW8302605.1 transcriptional repressor [Bacteroidia bacterium]
MNVEETLKKAGLRLTETRKAVLSVFFQSQKALSHSDLETMLKNYDRVTLYRTLSTFLEKDLIHKILNPDGVAVFALCRHESYSTQKLRSKLHNHAHFVCKICKETRCIDEFEIEIPNYLLNSTQIDEISVVLQGTCATCIKSQQMV